MQTITQDTDYILVGEITAPFGIRGEVKVRTLLARPQTLLQVPEVRLLRPDGAEELRKVLSLRHHQGVVLIAFDGVDRNVAETLHGTQLFLRRAEFPPLPEDEYYEWQLLGLNVVTDTGRPLGAVRRIHFNPAANDVYETEVALIPAVVAVVLSIDLEAGAITVRDIPGLRTDE